MGDTLVSVVQAANALIDKGVLTKSDQQIVSALLLKHDRGHKLDGSEMSRLRDVVERNEEL